MRQSTRLILNTLATYIRMFVTVGLGLYATRLASHALGAQDFGIWANLSAVAAILYVLSDGLTESAVRSLAFELGKPDHGRLRAVFSTTAALFAGMGLLALLVGLPLGYLAVSAIKGLPDARFAPALWSWCFIIGAVALSIASMPYRALFTARQRIFVLTVADTLDSVLRLAAIVIAASLQTDTADRLVWLCGLTLIGTLITTLAVLVLSLRASPDAIPRIRDCSRALVREIAGYSFWAIVGNLSYRVRLAGPPLILGANFGPLVNAAYAYASQIAGYQITVASAVSRATQPAVVTATGREDRPRILQLISLVNKYSVFIALFYLVPIMLETPTVLRLWLGDRADAADPLFVRLVMATLGIPWVYMGYHLAISATGRISRYMTIAVISEIIALAGSLIAVRWLGAPAWAVCAISAGTVSLFTLIYVAHISRVLHLSLAHWFTGTWVPVLTVALPSLAAAGLTRSLLPEGWPRLLAVAITYALVALPLIWFLGMAHDERGHFSRIFTSGLHRLRRPAAA
ncbi:MAG: lipopolysaccharide biosynthesis protein [Phycisphaerales bacterium]